MSLVHDLRAEVKRRKSMVWVRQDVLALAKRQEDTELIESAEKELRDRQERLAVAKHALKKAKEEGR